MMAVDVAQFGAAIAASEDDLSPLSAVRGKVRTLVLRRLAWLEHLHAEQGGLLAGPAHSITVQERDIPSAEQDFYLRAPEVQPLNRRLSSYEALVAKDEASPLARLCATFALTQAERSVLELCLTLALEPALAVALPVLQGDASTSYVTEALVAKLCGRSLPMLSAASALSAWKLVTRAEARPGEPSPLVLDPYIVGFAGGDSALDPFVAARCDFVNAHRPLADWPLLLAVSHAREACRNNALRVIVKGPEGSGRRTFAASVASALGFEAVSVDLSGLGDAEWPEFHLHVLRQAFLLGHCVIWTGSGVARPAPRLPARARLQFVCVDQELRCPASSGHLDWQVELPALGVDQRQALWKRFLPQSAAWSEAERVHVAERYRVQVGDIARIAASGAAQVDEVSEQCRAVSRDRLGDLGQLLPCTLVRDDLVLSAPLNRALDDFLFEARARARFWERPASQRLFPRGRGLVALMTGPPGTGKTTAAQVVARELGLDLIRIDVAASVSKYIGETAKNLQRIFARAREMNAVLFFDEADALFSKRTDVRDAHDRYANTDTNYLLQLLEDHDGVALLASNKKGNIDPAFVRRIRFLLDFPRPGAEERLSIWRRLVGELAGAERAAELDPMLRALSAAVELSGAQIKFALLSALFMAEQEQAAVGLPHLYRAIDRELLKDGRNLTGKDIERVEREGLRS